MTKINIISGTNRQGSTTLKLAQRLNHYYKSLEQQTILTDLRDLPIEIFNSQIYQKKPASLQPFLDNVLKADGLLMVVPEYNGSLPGILKYFIDLLEFPDSFISKPVAFVGLAAGKWGGLRAVEHLQQIFSYRNAYIFPQRIFLPGVSNEITDQGHIVNKDMEKRLIRQCRDFVDFITKLQKR